jgi:hypothetical protein
MVLDYLKLIMLFKVLLLKKILGAGSGSRSGSRFVMYLLKNLLRERFT